MTGRITDATPGDPAVPVSVTVSGFINIGQFALTMKFDTTRVRFISASPSASLPGMTVTYTHPAGNTQGKLVFSWTGAANTSLPDNAEIAGLVFHYVTGTGNLNWAYTFGSVCQYKRFSGSTLITLTDTPKYQYYLNGGISCRSAPVALAPEVADPAAGPFSLPIHVSEFINIKSFTLYLEYDPAVITYMNSFTKNPAFDSNFIVGDNPSSGGKRTIVIQWYGAPVSLADGALLCNLNFTYPAPQCNACLLQWYDTGPTCEFTDSGGDVLIDQPKLLHYDDGVIASGLPATWTGSVNTSWENTANWNSCGIPDQNKKAVIPDVSPNHAPVIATTAYVKSIDILPGATLIIQPGGTLQIGN